MFRLGLIASLIYLVAVGCLAFFFGGEFTTLKPNELGDFLAGAVGPVALFWVVLGFYQQGKELKNSTEALRVQAEELKNSVEQQAALVKVSEKQFELQHLELMEARKADEVLQLPFLVIRRAGGGGVQGGEFRNRLVVINRAKDAEKIFFEISNDSFRLEPETKMTVLSGEQFELYIIGQEMLRDNPRGAILSARSISAEGNSRIQEFDVSLDTHPLVNNETVFAK